MADVRFTLNDRAALPAAQRVAAAAPIAASLLPGAASDMERAVLTAELARLMAFEPLVILTVWDPERCPAVLLPWLAWALSVDVWDPQWDEARKRRVVAAAFAIHRIKGVRGAVERALEALGMSAGIVEWWEAEPIGRRGTFDVTVYAAEHLYDDSLALLDERVQQAAITAVRATKPKSRTFTFRLGLEPQARLRVGALATLRRRPRVNAVPFARLALDTSQRVGAVAVMRRRPTVSATPRLDLKPVARLGLGAVVTLRRRVQIYARLQEPA